MIAAALRGILFTIVAFVALLPLVAFSQQLPADTGAGIWIADASGQLRRAEPRPATFLSQAGSANLEVVLAVETFAHSATGALAAGELTVARVIGATSRVGATTGDITRQPAIVQPLYERPRVLAGSWERPRVLGFTAFQSITVSIADSRRVGLLIDLAMGAGATGVLDVVEREAAAVP